MTTPSTSQMVLAWHFCRDDHKTRYTGEPIVVGGELSATGALDLCSNGMHASERATDALKYAPGFTICRVELSGQILRGNDKLCARHRRVIAMADAKRALLEYAADCAERALLRIKSPDLRSVAAVQAVRDYANAKITAAKLRDFREAAWRARRELWSAAAAAAAAAAADAAAAAAAYADAAAYAAAAYAAAAAADAAAYAAAAAAYADADAASRQTALENARKQEREWQENALSKRLLELLGLPTT